MTVGSAWPRENSPVMPFETSEVPTIAAIKSFNKPVHLIVGGYDKGLSYDNLIKTIINSNIKTVSLIGQTGIIINQMLKKTNYTGNVVVCKDLSSAVKHAYINSQPGDIVLFSQPQRHLTCSKTMQTGAINSKI